MTSLTIAIPTRNRFSFLRSTLEHMLELPVPRGLEVHFAVAATACQDDTPEYLETLMAVEKRVRAVTQQTTWTRWNMIHLSKAVPKETDWVWLFGDDDHLVTPDSWNRVAQLIDQAQSAGASIICIPQAKRVKFEESIHLDKLASLCARFGLHEVTGWMTSLVMRRDVFSNLMVAIRNRLSRVRTDAGMLRTMLSPFFHSLELLKQNSQSLAILALIRIVDEQIDPSKKSVHTNQARIDEHLRDRLAYTFHEHIEFLSSNNGCKDHYFYRYVNKTFPDLMANIIAEDLMNRRPELLIVNKLNQLANLISLIESKSIKPASEIHRKLTMICARRHTLSSDEEEQLNSIYFLTKTPYLGEHVEESQAINPKHLHIYF
jgi:hypothetical protein